MAKVKNLALAEGEKAEPEIRAIGEEQVVKASSALIANTASEAASLVSLYDACPDRVFVVPPGVDLKTYKVGAGKSAARAKLLIKPDTLLLAFVGRIQPHKGPDVLIRAVALREAAQGGFDDAIFVNERGEVMESALANLLYLKDGQWFTPDLNSGCLPGVIRALLIENFGVIQAPLLVEEVEKVDGLALTSSVREIIGVQAFEGHLYSNSKMINELTSAFHSWILGNLEQ